jgi:diaminohydroxyphosphoribosylaminopyrimidine deaminase/5-amino-6-(5-phosphoribosylamino)uracil reductase
MLRDAGLAVTEDVLAAQARAANAGFLKKVTQALPFLTLKLATTLDGRIATETGESRWITGPASRRAVHAMRMSHDAVMVGSGTALADDPDLTVRDMGAVRQPLRIVIDSALQSPAQGRLGRTARTNPVWMLHGPNAPAERRSDWVTTGAELIAVPQAGGHLDLAAALRALAARGLTRIFCEGGAGLAAALIRAGLVDELVMFSAGKLIGQEGRAALGPLMLKDLADAPRLRLLRTGQAGPDTLSHWAFD